MIIGGGGASPSYGTEHEIGLKTNNYLRSSECIFVTRHTTELPEVSKGQGNFSIFHFNLFKTRCSSDKQILRRSEKLNSGKQYLNIYL